MLFNLRQFGVRIWWKSIQNHTTYRFKAFALCHLGTWGDTILGWESVQIPISCQVGHSTGFNFEYAENFAYLADKLLFPGKSLNRIDDIKNENKCLRPIAWISYNDSNKLLRAYHANSWHAEQTSDHGVYRRLNHQNLVNSKKISCIMIALKSKQWYKTLCLPSAQQSIILDERIIRLAWKNHDYPSFSLLP